MQLNRVAAILEDSEKEKEDAKKIPKLEEFQTTVQVNGGDENDMDKADSVEHSDPNCVDNNVDKKHIHHLHGTWSSLCGDE